MIAPLLLLLAAQLALVPQVQAQASSTDVGSFFVPPNSQGSVTTFDNIPVWTIGEQKTIEYTTVYETYTIALYQENLDGQSAAPGPNAYSKSNGCTPRSIWYADLVRTSCRQRLLRLYEHIIFVDCQHILV